MKQRTAHGNQIRGLLAEFGIVVAKGLSHLYKLPEILERHQNKLSLVSKEAFLQLHEQLKIYSEQEGLSLSTFSGWLKLSGLPIREESKSNFIPVEVSSHPVKKKSVAMGLQFKFPNGLIIEGYFSLLEVGRWLKELSDAFTSLR